MQKVTLGVDKTTLWRWESGQTQPKSKDDLERLKRAYGASQDELNAWFAGATAERDGGEASYIMRGHDLLLEKGLDLQDLLDWLIEIDTQILPHVRSPEPLSSGCQCFRRAPPPGGSRHTAVRSSATGTISA